MDIATKADGGSRVGMTGEKGVDMLGKVCLSLLFLGLSVSGQSMLYSFDRLAFVGDPDYRPSLPDDPVTIREKRPLDRIRFDFKKPLVFGNGESFYEMVERIVSESTRPSSAVKPIIVTNAVSIYVPGNLGSIKTQPGDRLTFPKDLSVKTPDGEPRGPSLDILLHIVPDLMGFSLIRHGDLYFFVKEHDRVRVDTLCLRGKCPVEPDGPVTAEVKGERGYRVLRTDFTVDRAGRYLCIITYERGEHIARIGENHCLVRLDEPHCDDTNGIEYGLTLRTKTEILFYGTVKQLDGLNSVIDLDLPMRDNPSDVKREKDSQPSNKEAR